MFLEHSRHLSECYSVHFDPFFFLWFCMELCPIPSLFPCLNGIGFPMRGEDGPVIFQLQGSKKDQCMVSIYGQLSRSQSCSPFKGFSASIPECMWIKRPHLPKHALTFRKDNFPVQYSLGSASCGPLFSLALCCCLLLNFYSIFIPSCSRWGSDFWGAGSDCGSTDLCIFTCSLCPFPSLGPQVGIPKFCPLFY